MKRALDKKDEELSIDLILYLHSIATYNAIDNNAIFGELRNDNSITISNIYNEVAHEPPCYESLKERLKALPDYH